MEDFENTELFAQKKKQKQVLTFFVVLKLIGLLGLVASPFIWIWGTFAVAWKVGLSGFVFGIIMVMVYNNLKKVFNNG